MDTISTDNPQLDTEQPKPWDYARVLHLHQRAKEAGLIEPNVTLQQFAQQMNEDTGSGLFAAGLHDNKIKRASVAIDEALQKTGIPDASADLFGGIGKLISPDLEETGRKIGEGFPRGAAQSALTLGGLALTPVAPYLGIPMAAVGSADTFAKTYTESDSPVAGLISAGAQLALPKFMSGGASMLAKAAGIGGDVAETVVNGARVAVPISQPGAGIAERALDMVGMNLGAAANQELAQQATSVASGNGFFNPFSKEHAFELAVGQLPFLPFQAKDVIKGPGKGEFRSFSELNRAREAATLINKASKENAERAYLYTAEHGDPTVQDEHWMGGDMPQYSAFGEPVVTTKEVETAQKHASTTPDKTLMGDDITTTVPSSGVGTPTPVNLLTPKQDFQNLLTMPGEEFMKLTQGLKGPDAVKYQQNLAEFYSKPELIDLTNKAQERVTAAKDQAAKSKDKADIENYLIESTRHQYFSEALKFKNQEESHTDVQMKALVEAAHVAVQVPVKTADDLHATAKLTNDIAKHNGETTPPITDQFLQSKVEQNLSNGSPIADSTAMAAQSTQNRLNRVAAELEQKLTKGEKTKQAANEKLAALPAPVQDVIGKKITELSKQHSGEMDTDLSDAWTQAAVKWAENPENAKLAASQKPEDQAKALESLGKVLGGAKKLKTLERTRSKTEATGGAESIYSEEQPGSLKPVVENLSENGKETLGDIVKAEDDIIEQNGQSLVGDVTLEEAKTVNPKATPEYAKKLSAIVAAFAKGDIQREYKNGKWKFTYNNIEELYSAFPKVAGKTIMNFVRDNYQQIGQILQKRMKIDLLSFTHPEGLKVELDPRALEPAKYGTLPVVTRAFFTHHFLNKGYAPAEASRLGDVAMRVAAQYKEISANRITSLFDKTGKSVLGIQIQPSRDVKNGVIGINTAAQLSHIAGGSFDTFLKLHTLAHEEFHSLQRAYEAGQLVDNKAKVFAAVLDAAQQMSDQDRRFILQDVFDAIVPSKVRNNREVNDLINQIVSQSKSSPTEFLATYSGLVLLGAASPSEIRSGYAALKDHILFGDKHLADFMQQQFVDLANVSEAYKDFLILNKNVNPEEANLMHLFNKGFKDLMETKEIVDRTVSRLRVMDVMNDGGLGAIIGQNTLQPIVVDLPTQPVVKQGWLASNIDPEYRGLSADFLALMTQKPTAKDLLGSNLNWYERNLVPAAQIAERFPITRPVINLGFTFNSVKNKFVTMALTPFMTPDKFGRLVFDEEHSGLTKVLHDEKLNDAFSKVALENNLLQKEGKPVLSDEQIAARASESGLDADQTAVLQQTVKNTGLAMESMAGAIVRSRKDLIGNLAARVLMSRNPTLDAKTARTQGQALVDAMIASAGQDPTGVAQGAQALAQVQAAIGNPEAFQTAVNAVNGILPQYAKLAQTLSKANGYTPEVRLGDYKLRWVEDGKTHFVGLKTRAEFEQRLSELHKNPAIDQTSIKGYEKFDQNNDLHLLRSDMVQNFADIERSAYETRKAMFPEDADTLDRMGYVPGEAAFKEVTAQGIGKYTLRRKLVAGREEINMMEGVLDYITGVSAGLAKAHTRDLAALYLADPSLKANPKIQAFLRDHIASVTSSQKEWQSIKNAVFHFTLGGNLSSILVERLQPLFSLAPHLTQYGAGIAGSYKYMGRAMQLLSDVARGKTSAFDPKLQIPEMLKRATDDRLIDFGVYQELVNHEDVAVTNLRNLAVGNKEVNSVTSLLGRPLLWYTRFARNVYTKAAAQNNRIAFLASYLLAMEKGVNGERVTPEQAYQFAYDSVHTTMFGGGRAGRPVGMFSNLGKAYGAVSAYYMLQHYTTSSIAMMYRLMMDSFSKSGLEPYQVSQSRKALGQMVLTQTLMAGTLGLPLVGGTIALLEQIFPELKAKQAIRETLAKLGGDDRQMGELISDSFLHGGLPRALGLGMVDLSGRFGLGNIFGVDPEYGFRPESIFGAPGSVLGNILRGIGKASTGQLAEGIEQAAPSGWKNLIRLYNDDWNVRDSKGRLLFEPDETEKTLAAIGFRPKRLAQFQEQKTLLERSDQIASAELQRFHSDLADLLLQGQVSQVRALLLQKHQEDPLYDPRAGLRSVSQIAQDKTVPVDVSRGGVRANLDERERINQTFNSTSRPSEVDLLLRRKQLERSVGLVGAGTLGRSELTIAQLADRFEAQGVSRALARALAERQLARNPLSR